MYEKIDELKAKLDAERPFTADQFERIDKELTPRRIYSTNIFEDNSLTLEETRFYLETNRMAGGKLKREFQEIDGVREAIKFIEDKIEARKDINEEMIKELHSILTEPIDQVERYHPGEYKDRDMPIIAKDGTRLNFVPFDRVPAEMSALFSWYNEGSGKVHPLELAAKFHYRFTLIHPFFDGNGRMARLLDDFILGKNGYGPAMIEDKAKYYAALHDADDKLPATNRPEASVSLDIAPFIEVICDSSCNCMQIMLDALAETQVPIASDLAARLQTFDKVLSGDSSTDLDKQHIEEKEAAKLAIGREISEYLKGKLQSKYVQFLFSGPAKFQQNNHEYSPLISEVVSRHNYTFAPNESLYEYHFAPNIAALEEAGMTMEPFMKLMSFAVISHDTEVGVFSGLMDIEFGKVYIKQENREEIVMKLRQDSVRELVGSSLFADWELKDLRNLIYSSLDYFFQQIENDYAGESKDED
ncbi:hypothetical protein CEE37_04490 [candidate division LCP-89 bacterium B3_LCP]|uniref:Fido domain-containing protein n=1 Tax=candidate division LCP-89 bacterium B3_LCP TaxID=2012998 RepID=A0A532V3Y3_UNCL8|nr:MAG: hypothetical protein CEE37_04490 [candidate division LCP-89 bacterium B3_LCP]